MASKPIPGVGRRAFRLLTDAYTEKKVALERAYQQECQDLGDEILEVLGVDPKDPAFCVNYDEGVATGFMDPVVADIIQQTMAKLRLQRDAEGVPPDGTIVEAPAEPALVETPTVEAPAA